MLNSLVASVMSELSSKTICSLSCLQPINRHERKKKCFVAFLPAFRLRITNTMI